MYQDLGFAAPPCTGHRFRGVAIGGDLKGSRVYAHTQIYKVAC